MNRPTAVRNADALYRRRRSSVARDCEHCGARIGRGQAYYTSSLPPGKDVNNSPKWWTLKLCEACGSGSPAGAPTTETTDG